MRQPESNGLFETVGGKQQKERGFVCMQLIKFLTNDDVKGWDNWHGAHEQAAAGACPYSFQCHIHARTVARLGKRPIQLTLF